MNILRRCSAVVLSSLIAATLAVPARAFAAAEPPPVQTPTTQQPESPPVQTPTTREKEPPPAEAPTTQEPESPPVQVPAAQRRPAPAPAPTPKPRSHATPLTQPQLQPEPKRRADIRVNPRTPGYRTGAGLLTGGGFSGAAGIALIVWGSVDYVQWKRDDSETRPGTSDGAPLIGIGSVALAGGATLAAIGGLRYRRFRQARARDRIDYPDNGSGRTTAGIILTGSGAQLFAYGVVGGIISLIAAPYAGDTEAEQTGLSYGGVMLIMACTGAVAIPVGAVLLHYGIKQHRQQQAFWKSGWYSLVPSVAPTTRGAAFGVAGRF